MSKKLKLVPSPIYPCGEAEQSAQHVVQECRLFEAERNATWPQHTSLQEKLLRKQGGTREDNTLHLEPYSPSVKSSERKEEEMRTKTGVGAFQNSMQSQQFGVVAVKE